MKITDPSLVARALDRGDLVPPPAPDTLGSGATMELREARARFRSGDRHDTARRDVNAAVAAIDLDAVRHATRRIATEHMALREHCDVLADIAFVVPTEVLAATLGVASAELAEVRRDVRSIVLAIGRGEPATEVADAASRRLLDRFAGQPGGAVATVSMLYQNHDATAALLAATLVANEHREPRRNAVARTVRVATADVVIGDLRIDVGSTIEVGLEGEDQEFGAGPHACPGSEVAATIVEEICVAMVEHRWGIDIERAEFADDGRARTLPRRLLDADLP